MSKTRRGISYVLGESNDDENHILPINSIQYSSFSNKFYTGGRDGTVKEWSTTESHEPREDSPQFFFSDTFKGGPAHDELDQDLSERILKLETSISANPLSYNSQVHHNFNITHSHNIHFDWINDLVLINQDRKLVSCSSDLSLKLLHLDRLNEITKFANIHTDYVKKVAYMRGSNMLLSGGYDGKIALWDMNTLAPVLQINTERQSPSMPSSIYSLASSSANTFCSGGPNSIVNFYDTRIPNHTNVVRRLLGHQDNVRCLLMNDNQILSGSSDSSIKLWDLRMFKVYKNFDIHDDSVWTMATAESSSPESFSTTGSSNFNVFYSADRSGTVLKTDLSYLSQNLTEHVFPDQHTFTANENASVDEKVGLTTIVAKNDSPILALCAETVRQNGEMSNPSLLVSTNGSLARYYVPETEQLAKYQYVRTCVDLIYNRHDDTAEELVADDQNDLNSDFYDLVSHLSVDTNNLDIQSSRSIANPRSVNNEAGTPKLESTDVREYHTMFVDQSGGPCTDFINAYNEGLFKENNVVNSSVDSTPVEIPLNPVPAERLTNIPFNKRPFVEYKITPKSIVSKRLFNNKRQMIVLYLNGDIKIWDLFVCQPIKTFPYEKAGESGMSKEVNEQRQKDMDDIFEDHNSMDTLNNWCEVEIKSGKLLVTLKEGSFYQTEIYYDELILAYPYLAYKHPDNDSHCDPNLKVSHDDRFQVSRIILNSLFHCYALYEWGFDQKLREELRNLRRSSLTLAEEPSPSNGSTTSKRIKMFRKISSKTSITRLTIPESTSGTTSSSNSIDENIDTDPEVAKFIGINEETGDKNDISKNLYNYDTSIMKLLQLNKKKYSEKYHAQGKQKQLTDSILKIYSNDPKHLSNTYKNEASDSYKPRINPKRLPSNLLIIIFEYSPDLGNLRDVLSFHFEDLQKLNYDHDNDKQRAFVHDLRTQLPRWIGHPILYDKFPPVDSSKVSFQLLEMDYSKLEPHQLIGGKSQRKIKKLPIMESLIKLTAHEMLRVGKILTYLTDKFESRTAEMKDHRDPSEWLALECRGKELPVGMTLQTIKAKVWKSSSDIELVFRRKFDT